jgi:hypothetical protein
MTWGMFAKRGAAGRAHPGSRPRARGSCGCGVALPHARRSPPLARMGLAAPHPPVDDWRLTYLRAARGGARRVDGADGPRRAAIRTLEGDTITVSRSGTVPTGTSRRPPVVLANRLATAGERLVVVVRLIRRDRRSRPPLIVTSRSAMLDHSGHRRLRSAALLALYPPRGVRATAQRPRPASPSRRPAGHAGSDAALRRARPDGRRARFSRAGRRPVAARARRLD